MLYKSLYKTSFDRGVERKNQVKLSVNIIAMGAIADAGQQTVWIVRVDSNCAAIAIVEILRPVMPDLSAVITYVNALCCVSINSIRGCRTGRNLMNILMEFRSYR